MPFINNSQRLDDQSSTCCGSVVATVSVCRTSDRSAPTARSPSQVVMSVLGHISHSPKYHRHRCSTHLCLICRAVSCLFSLCSCVWRALHCALSTSDHCSDFELFSSHHPYIVACDGAGHHVLHQNFKVKTISSQGHYARDEAKQHVLHQKIKGKWMSSQCHDPSQR